MKLDEVLKSKELTCAIPYARIGALLQAIHESAKDGREITVSFCGDSNQLSFPTLTGTPNGAWPAECPVDKKRVGVFHTHPHVLSTEKSLVDWHYDMEERLSVSCLGVESEDAPIVQRTIACHTFDTQHPEYENFRKRFVAVSGEVKKCELELIPILKSRPATVEESSRWIQGYYKIKRLVEEGKAKGIISPCVQFSIPDVERILAEQKEEEK